MIIIKVNTLLKSDQFQRLKRTIHDQKATGVIVLPEYCSVEYADDKDVEIRVEPAENCTRN